MDPVLAARFAKQREKEEAGEGGVPDIGPGAVAQHAVHLDPVLAKRFARQQEKLELGESIVDTVESKPKAAAVSTRPLDPTLAKRFAKQQEKEEAGEDAPVVEIGSAAEVTTKLDPLLAMRLAKQQEKLSSGQGGADLELSNETKVQETELHPELAQRFARRRQQEEREAADAALHENGRGAASAHGAGAGAGGGGGGGGPRPPPAERRRLSISAGERRTVTVALPEGGSTWAQVHWSVVVLDEQEIDLQISAQLRTSAALEADPETLVLQRNARGGNFHGHLAPRRDRRLLARPAEGAGQLPARGADGGPEATALAEPSVRAVDGLRFEFGNAFTWFSGKEVELVVLYD